MQLLLMEPILHIKCKESNFKLSKHTWHQFAYFRLVCSKCDEKEFVREAPDDMCTFFEFLRSNTIDTRHLHKVASLCIELGIDMTGSVCDSLSFELNKWIQMYVRECVQLVETACAPNRLRVSLFLPREHQFDPFYVTQQLQQALVHTVLPLDGDPILDFRNFHIIRSVWTGGTQTKRATMVRAALENAFAGRPES